MNGSDTSTSRPQPMATATATEESLTNQPLEVSPVARAVMERFAERTLDEILGAGWFHATSQTMMTATQNAKDRKNTIGQIGLALSWTCGA